MFKEAFKMQNKLLFTDAAFQYPSKKSLINKTMPKEIPCKTQESDNK